MSHQSKKILIITDFDGTIQTQSACGTFSAIPDVSFVTDPGNGGVAMSRAQASGDPGISLSIGAFAESSGVALSASAGANGSISPAGSVGVLTGASQTFQIIPATWYAVSNVLEVCTRVEDAGAAHAAGHADTKTGSLAAARKRIQDQYAALSAEGSDVVSAGV